MENHEFSVRSSFPFLVLTYCLGTASPSCHLRSDPCAPFDTVLVSERGRSLAHFCSGSLAYATLPSARSLRSTFTSLAQFSDALYAVSNPRVCVSDTHVGCVGLCLAPPFWILRDDVSESSENRCLLIVQCCCCATIGREFRCSRRRSFPLFTSEQ